MSIIIKVIHRCISNNANSGQETASWRESLTKVQRLEFRVSNGPLVRYKICAFTYRI